MLYRSLLRNSHRTSTNVNAFEPDSSASRGDDREIWDIRVLLLVVLPLGMISALAPKMPGQSQFEISFLPQLLFLLAALLLLFNLHLASQRKLQHQGSTVLAAATS